MKSKKLSKLNLSCLSVITSLPLYSTAILAEDDELFFQMPVVLSANRLEQPVTEAAVSISVIDRATIEASGARTIPEILRLVPGMQVGYSGNEFGDEPKYVVSYHGHSDQYSKQMQVLIDGRSIYEPFFGGINWKAIPVNIDDIERIEVSRGPNLATYGANSFMAAINIITRTAAEDQGSYLRSNLGNHDIRDLSYRYGGSSGELDYRITASTLNDDGLDSINANDNPDDTNSNNIDYRLDYQLDNKNSISYQGGYGYNRQQSDRNHEDVIPRERTVKNTRLFQFIKWENTINAQNTVQLQYYYNLSDRDDHYVSDQIDPGGPDPFVLDIDAGVKSERHNLELTHFTNPADDLKLVWGLSSQFDFVTSSLYLGTEDKVTNEQYRAFANLEYQIDQHNILNLGALVEKNSFSDTEVSPRISLTHAFNPRHKLRLGISRAVRNPFTFEAVGNQTFRQQLTIGGDPTGLPILRENAVGSSAYRSGQLNNEVITSHEIVYMGEFLQTALLFNARLFYDEMDNYIDTLKEDDNMVAPNEVLFDNFVFVFRNPISSRTSGLELELDYSIDPTLRVIASSALIYIDSNSDAISRSAPKQTFSTFITKQFNQKYSGSLGYYYVSKFKWTDARGTDDYDILDLRLSRNFRLEKSYGSVSLVLKNLLGDYNDYNEDPRNPSAPKIVQNSTAYLDLRLNF